MSTITPELESSKGRLKATWMAGDYGISQSILNWARRNLSYAWR